MPLPHPEPGLVISYSYLWRYEHEKGKDEGRKTRPCVIILAIEKSGDDTVVTVAPVTHSPPHDPMSAMEIPAKVKQHLGLDNDPSWVILSEVNEFIWPGYDLQPVPDSKDRYDYGFLPPKLYEKIRNGILDLIVKRRTAVTRRD